LKKILAAALCLTLILAAVPVTAAAADTAGIIDMHGAKTYIGPASAWSGTWDPSKFDEVTDEDAEWTGSLTIKSGSVDNVVVDGSNPTVTVTTGTIGSISSEGNVTLNGGTIKHDVTADKTITFSGDATVKGTCSATDITATGSKTATVNTLEGSGTITLGSTGVKANNILGDGSGTLELKNYTLTLSDIDDMDEINVTGDATVTGELSANAVTIASKKQLTAKSTAEIGTLNGPGTLAFVSGKLTIHGGVNGNPMITFLNTVHNGSLAFKADHGAVDEDEITLYDYSLEKDTDGDSDSFYLTDSIKEGVTLSETSVSVDSKNSASIKAYIRPSLSKFATGTKLVWELHGDTAAFSISPDSANNACKVSLKGAQTGTHSATLTAYLVDAHGDRLADYKSGTCSVSLGSGQTAPVGLALDTTAVTIPVGGTYSVLAVTTAATPPVQLSYNSAVATVGAAKAYSAGGKTGWLYPVYGIAKGQVTIDIGGQKMITTVSGGSIIVDTSSYTMAPGGKYCIGVRMYGVDRRSVNVHSANSCTTIQYGGNVKGLELYTVKAETLGTGYAIFDLPGGQSVRTEINVQAGASPHGVSARLIAAQ
jgi:hypothetical protein